MIAYPSKFLNVLLQEKNQKVKCFLIDPPGSGLFNKVTRGVMYTKEEAEGRRLKNPFDTVTEGIGINRLTENFKMANLDGAFRGTDLEAVEMSRLVCFLHSSPMSIKTRACTCAYLCLILCLSL